MLNSKRLNQVSYMFSVITGLPQHTSLNIILKTNTGQNILDNNPIEMYEQETANLYNIATELKDIPEYKNFADQLLKDGKIVEAMKKILYDNCQ